MKAGSFRFLNLLGRTAVISAAVVFSFEHVAAQDSGCALPDLTAKTQKIVFLGDDAEEAKPGDRRILLHLLFDDAGREVGDVHVHSTVMHPRDDDSSTIYVQGTMNLENGSLHWSSNQLLSDPTDETRSNESADESVVSGGTGDFRHARGAIIVSPIDRETFRVEFEIICDD